LGSREDEPLIITVLWKEVAMVEKFVYLGCLIHSTTGGWGAMLHVISWRQLTFASVVFT